MTKVDIISGFLGAGKTTFIKRLLKENGGEKTVIIENEFGEIGIDSGFLQDAGVEITEMNSGCICCSLVGDFKEALLKVCEELNPERIIIEPSGVGKLSDVIKAVSAASTNGSFIIRGNCAVVDAKKFKMHLKNFGEFFLDQIKNANAIVLSHTEDITEEKLSAVINSIREHNDKAEIISTHYSLLPVSVILEAMEEGKTDIEIEVEHHHHHHEGECECHCHDHEHHHHHGGECHCHDHEHHHHHHEGECHCHDHDHHHADEVFDSIGGETGKKFTNDEIKNILEELESEKFGFILRAKGYLASAEGFIYFDYIPESIDIRVGEAMPIGKFCVIGTKLNTEEVKNLFLN